MKIGIIGAGRVGSALAIGLAKEKFPIEGVFNKTDNPVKTLGEKIGVSFNNSLEEVVSKADTVFITVPDDILEKMSLFISEKISSEVIKGKVFLHCSGACTSGVLGAISEKGGFTGSLHPIQTFADRTESWRGLYNIYYGFEGSYEAQKAAETIVKAFNGRLLIIDSEAKPLYHAAACVLSNYTVVLSYIAGGLLKAAGLDKETGIKALAPLAAKTIKNIELLGPEGALTGPVSRGDSGVIAQHLDAMSKRCPEFIDIYRTLGKTAFEIALKNGSINEEKERRLRELLQ
ncbi:MAG TPA: DUF2520 domain-containing protein [Clostridiaceae bacterium]|nr:DUF2520 domain-containing protein [Clostridiaceae bacterium]